VLVPARGFESHLRIARIFIVSKTALEPFMENAFKNIVVKIVDVEYRVLAATVECTLSGK
jgi:hypothetical protein